MDDFESDNTCTAAGCDNNNTNNPQQLNNNVRKWAGQLAQSAAHTMQELTARKYTLPDKNVASQLLMYRQLLHTKCRPGLKLSRDYQGTPAQQAVKHMPWWAQGCETTGKMVISYDNLVRRLWLHGAIFPYSSEDGSTSGGESSMNTLLNAEGMPPIPHEYWVHRLGFQQQDPVTDFRSGGVLSLALMLHVAESCPNVFSRFVRTNGDASVLPFGITSINVTDMLSKFLMLAKTVDRMDALLSQKPFWRMFADPNAITACQELSMDMLADVVVEVAAKRGRPVTVFDFSSILATTERRVQYDLLGAGPKTVAELYQVHARVRLKYQQQLENNMLCGTFTEEDTTTSTNTTRTAVPGAQNQQQQQETQLQPQRQQTTTSTSPNNNNNNNNSKELKEQVLQKASVLASSATNIAGSVFSRIKQQAPAFNNPLNRKNHEEADHGHGVGASAAAPSSRPSSKEEKEPIITIDFSPAAAAGPTSNTPTPPDAAADLLSSSNVAAPAPEGVIVTTPAPSMLPTPPLEEEEWVQAGEVVNDEEVAQAAVTDAVSHFSIEDEDDKML